MLRDLLRPEGFPAGRKPIGTLMARMGIEALYRKPNPSRRQRRDEIPPSCAISRSSDPIRCGQPTSPTSRCAGASSPCLP